jgi:hypothetical protein
MWGASMSFELGDELHKQMAAAAAAAELQQKRSGLRTYPMLF